MAAAQYGEPCEREDDRAKDTDQEDWASGALGCAGGVVGVLVRRGGVVADRKEMALGNGLRGGELASVQLVVGEIVVRDAEVLAGRNAECKSSTGAEIVLAGSDGGESFGPLGVFFGEVVDG